jgi:predicted acyltransferase|tara:strand:- start:409 stop:1515 length:1107 start_codon:yes stop_codon:yes gene_type:complete
MTIAAMILVNTPGSWGHVYAPLRHADWHGWTPTDLIFPFFLFIVGVAMTFSIQTRIGVDFKSDIYKKVIKRSVILFLLGLLLNFYPFGIPFTSDGWSNFSFSSIIDTFMDIRIMGVLQRISLCYLISSVMIIYLTRRLQYYAAFGLLAIYATAMLLYGNFTLEDNLARTIDLAIFSPSNMYTVQGLPFDPEGVLSTIPAVVTTLSGVFVGNMLRRHLSPREKAIQLIIWGLSGILLGNALNIMIPINKQLWTPSYVFLTSGWACLILSIFYWLIEIKNIKSWAKPFIVFGSNSIIVFVASGILVTTILKIKIHLNDGSITSLYNWIYKYLFVSWAEDLNGSLFFAITWILLWLGVLWILYIRKIFIKI